MEQTWGCSDVTEGTDEDKDEDEDRDEEKNEVKDRAAGCIVGQPRATEKRAKPSRGERVSWPPLSPSDDITDDSVITSAQEQLEHLDPHPGPSIGGNTASLRTVSLNGSQIPDSSGLRSRMWFSFWQARLHPLTGQLTAAMAL